VEILILAGKERMFLYGEYYIQVPRRSAVGTALSFAAYSEAGGFIYTGRDLQFQYSLLLDLPVSPTGGTGLLDEFPYAATTGAGSTDSEKALLVSHTALSGTGGTGGHPF